MSVLLSVLLNRERIRVRQSRLQMLAVGVGIQNRTEAMQTLVTLWKDESGGSAAEYALILAIVGTAIAAASIYLGNAISTQMVSAADCISDAATCATPPA